MAVLTVLGDERSLAEAVADRCAAIADEAVSARGEASWCLTGGNTPRRMYELLAGEPWRRRIAWDRVHLYWGDERHVPPDDNESNFKMARDALVMHVPIPASQVHRIRGEQPPDEAADLYERQLPRRFDLMLLGMGADAHIASIFPGSPVAREQLRRVAAVWAPHLERYRITLTPRSILAAQHIVLMVAGAAKAVAVAAALEQPTDPDRYPAHLLREADDRVEWFIDRAAAQGLSSQRG